MRLFPEDEVPRLRMSAEEMPGPWVIPHWLPRRHRNRLAAVVVRALRAFDPRVRCIQLRWAELPLIRQCQIRLPERVLVWWRMDSSIDPRQEVLWESQNIVRGLHLFDFDEDPGVTSLGWLAPLKVELLHRVTDSLLEDTPDRDAESWIAVLNWAAERLLSPIDLLDFSERLLEARAGWLDLERARVAAMAVVLAGYIATDAPDAVRIERYIQDFEQTIHVDGSDWARTAQELFTSTGFADVASVWLGDPRVLERVLELLRRAIARPVTSLPPPHTSQLDSTRPKALVPRLAEARDQMEERASAVLEALRRREHRTWSQEERRAAAAVLEEFANATQKLRGEARNIPLLEREASLLGAAAQLLKDAGAAKESAKVWIDTGARLRDAYHDEQALEAASRAEELTAASSELAIRAQALILRGEVSARRDSVDVAREAFETALPILRQVGDRTGEARCLVSLGDLLRQTGDLPGAQRVLEDALTTFRETDDRRGEASCLLALGGLQLRGDHTKNAQESYETALLIFRQIGDRSGEARCLVGLGDTQQQTDRLVDAQQAYEAALPLLRETVERFHEARCLVGLGDIRRRTEDRAGAQQAFDAALTICRGIRWRLGEANCLVALGDLRVGTGAAVDAGNAYDAAIQIYREIGNRHGEANSLQGLGQVSLEQNRLGDAFRQLVAALKLYRQIGEGDTFGEQAVHGYLALAASRAGFHDQALVLAERSFDIGQKIEDRSGLRETLKLQLKLFCKIGDQSASRAVEQMLQGLGPPVADGVGLDMNHVVATDAPGETDLRLSGKPEDMRRQAVKAAEERLSATGRDAYSELE